MQSVKNLSIKAPQPPKAPSSERLLIAASGTGGHLFPALAVAEKLAGNEVLSDSEAVQAGLKPTPTRAPFYQIEWLGVPNRLETRLVPAQYPLHAIDVEGFQKGFGLGSIQIFSKFISAIFQVRHLLQQGKFRGVFTTGGYIAAPAIIAARSLGLPAILHESNALPGKVTRWLSPWCSTVALGFETAAQYLPRARTFYVGTPVRSSFLHAQKLAIAIPDDAPLIVVIGGSQGAVAVNRLVRQCAPAWLREGAWIVHLTGENDPGANELQHPHYLSMPFYDKMAGLLQRADLAISRAGAGTLTELAVAGTPAILIPFPYAAEDHQTHNARVFAAVGAALVFREAELTADVLEAEVLKLLRMSYGQEFGEPLSRATTPRQSVSIGESPVTLQTMAQHVESLAVRDSTERLVTLIRQLVPGHSLP
jgi:UDP-N-acetylglucosamine--N-acetylmuramyl-(pentapeptide) pyrophosphoryl-undecaprenol N-acetylglucosamine transferase